MPESAKAAALFPSFFMGGFESSTHIDRSHRRQDFIRLTQHDRFVRQDYERVRSIGLRVVREDLRWYLCERDWKRGDYDFSTYAPFVDAAQAAGITHITCLLHYGFPDGADPFQPDFPERFAAFATAFARWRVRHVDPPRWYGTVNELSFLAFAAGGAAWFAPFYAGEAEALTAALVAASFAATDAIRAEDPHARFVTIDPIQHRVPPPAEPHIQGECDHVNEAQYDGWDMLIGRKRPDLGGAPRYLDVIGVNSYPDSQTELGTERQLALDDPRRRPFRDLLLDVHRRYRRPIIIAETSARNAERPVWLRYVVDECLAAIREGVDLQGICLFPVVDMREWKRGQIGPWGQLGLWELRDEETALLRVPNERYLAVLAEAQAHVAATLGTRGAQLTLEEGHNTNGHDARHRPRPQHPSPVRERRAVA